MHVSNTEFDENNRGLYISGSDACQVTTNLFKTDTHFETDGGCGMYLDNCTGYKVEENVFVGTNTASPRGLGLVVHNSGDEPNELYRNKFENLDQGISAQQKNRITSVRNKGLQIICNEFDDCDADIFVAEPKETNWGINDYQGVSGTGPEDMAGNLFHYDNDTTIKYDDLNNEGHYFRYVYPSNPDDDYYNAKPEDITELTVGEVEKTVQFDDWTYDDGCPSQISSGGGGLKSTGSEFKELLAYYTEQVESLESTLADLIDGGNTEGLNLEVEFSTPPETMEIYNELIGESPFVSETVVETAIDKEEVLPNSLVRDVMVANSHAAKSDELLEKLDERNNPMPNYMKAQILEARDNISYKEELESQLSGLKLRQARTFNAMIREYLSDSLNPENISDSLVYLFHSYDTKNSKYRLAMLHIQRGEYDQGNSVMNTIPVEYGLSNEELAVHNNMLEYFNLIKAITQDGRTELEATEEEIQQLVDLEETETGIASAYARNILIALNEMEYLAPIQLPNPYKSTKKMEEYLEVMNSQPPSKLSVFPNPSKDFVIVEYHLEIEKGGIIEVKDVNGHLLNKIQVERLQDQVTVKTTSWKPGLYIATLKVNGKLIESCKFTLIK